MPTGRRSSAISWRHPFYTRCQCITARAGVDHKHAGMLPPLAHRHEPMHAVAPTCASRRLRRSRTNLISETSDRSCSPSTDVAGVGEPSPGADVERTSPVPVQMWQGRVVAPCSAPPRAPRSRPPAALWLPGNGHRSSHPHAYALECDCRGIPAARACKGMSRSKRGAGGQRTMGCPRSGMDQIRPAQAKWELD